MAKILIVDDSALSRKMLRSILAKTGHEVIEASGGLEAMEIFSSDRPHLVFLDLVMKDMHGLEVLEKLRQREPNCKVVIATADIQKTTKETAIEKGAIDFLNKPFQEEQILDIVKKYLG